MDVAFPTASAAVQCAIDIQKIASDHSDLVLRIGIHEGEITATEGDIIGDDVNVTSRIEPFSAPGGIAISGKIQQNISSLPDFKTMYLGQPKLKGVRQKVEIHCIVSQGLPKPDLKTVKAKLDLGQQSLFKKYVFPSRVKKYHFNMIEENTDNFKSISLRKLNYDHLKDFFEN